jgi:hypothetical protein
MEIKNFMKNKAKVCKTHLQVDKSIVYNLIRNKSKKNKKPRRRRKKNEKTS